MATLSIIVYGNGEFFKEYFSAIAASFGANTFSTLTRLAVVFSSFLVAYSYILKRDIAVMFKWVGMFYLATHVLFLPKVWVQIIDRINQQHTYLIDKVPLGLAAIASYTSVVGDELTQLVEMNFPMPDDLTYEKTGVVMASRILATASQANIADAQFSNNLKNFLDQCVFYDLLLNKYSISQLINSPNIWQLISESASPARAFTYDQQTILCRTGAEKLNAEWNRVINDEMALYGTQLFPTENDGQKAFKTYLTISYQFLTHAPDDAAHIMQQNMLINAINSDLIHLDPTPPHDSMGKKIADWLPLMKNAFEAILYACFIFIVLLTFFPFGLSVIKKYICGLLWLQLWAPLYAVVNLICSYSARVQSLAFLKQTSAITLKNHAALSHINQGIIDLAGYLALSIPVLVTCVVYGLSHSITQTILRNTATETNAPASEKSFEHPSLQHAHESHLSAPFNSGMFNDASSVSSHFSTTHHNKIETTNPPEVQTTGKQVRENLDSHPIAKTTDLSETRIPVHPSNDTQNFIEWLSNQPGTDGQGHLGHQAALQIFQHEPELAEMYLQQFSQNGIIRTSEPTEYPL
jgi:conjugal transfer mating pair stabilization protein TraG